MPGCLCEVSEDAEGTLSKKKTHQIDAWLVSCNAEDGSLRCIEAEKAKYLCDVSEERVKST